MQPIPVQPSAWGIPAGCKDKHLSPRTLLFFRGTAKGKQAFLISKHSLPQQEAMELQPPQRAGCNGQGYEASAPLNTISGAQKLPLAEVKPVHANGSHPPASHFSSLGRDSSPLLGWVDTTTSGGVCAHSPTDSFPRAALTWGWLWLWESLPTQQRPWKVLHGQPRACRVARKEP